jgi:hypothetical protein
MNKLSIVEYSFLKPRWFSFIASENGLIYSLRLRMAWYIHCVWEWLDIFIASENGLIYSLRLRMAWYIHWFKWPLFVCSIISIKTKKYKLLLIFTGLNVTFREINMSKICHLIWFVVDTILCIFMSSWPIIHIPYNNSIRLMWNKRF